MLIRLVACDNQQSRAHEQPVPITDTHITKLCSLGTRTKNTFKVIILRAARTEPQSVVRGARWSYRGPFSRRAVRAAKIKLTIASRDVWCKRTAQCLQRRVVQTNS
jgi:hypothetical protein